MTTDFCGHEIISIVIPVYNAQAYLGYCLNSVASQSYPYLQVILVNDGSKDNSLEICENYAHLDPRFRVISISNSGVSTARNTGIREANGKYLMFLDSDDVLHQDAVQKMVTLAQNSGKELVVGDVLMVDFSAPENRGPRLCADWTGKRPCIMDRDEFAQKRMRLIWYTSLLEGPYGKLYDLSLWKENDIQFPPELNLGEDFIANMQYYKNCNGVAFLGETIHYYNNIQNSNSLTHRYRPDLFECKMELAERLEEHLGGINQISKEERDCFHNYVASSGIRCIVDLIKNAPLTHEETKRRLDEMLSSKLFREAVEKADYIQPEYLAWRKFIANGESESIINYKKSALGQGILNRMLRKALHFSGRVMPATWRERFDRLEKDILYKGIKNSFREHILARKERIKKHSRAEAEKCFRENISQQLIDIKQELANEEKYLSDIEKELLEGKQEIQDYVWLSEQRMTRSVLLSQINDLRQRKKAVMIATAEHTNIGDAAITLAEQEFLLENFPDYYQVEFSTYEIGKKMEYLHAILNPCDIIFMNGGGNMGNRYREEEELHRQIVREFPNHKIVIFPQTIDFEYNENGRKELLLSEQVYNNHRDLTLFARGKESYDFACTHFHKAKVFLMSDMVHQLAVPYGFERSGILLCLRTDQEGIWSSEETDRIHEIVEHCGKVLYTTSNMADEDISRDRRALVVRQQLQNFASHQVVVTDRLHGMIFSVITGTPCVVLASAGPKIKDYYETFLKGMPGVFYAGTDLEKLGPLIAEAMDQPASAAFDVCSIKSALESLKRNIGI